MTPIQTKFLLTMRGNGAGEYKDCYGKKWIMGSRIRSANCPLWGISESNNE